VAGLVVFGMKIRVESTRRAPLKIPLDRRSSHRTERVSPVNDAAVLAPRCKRTGVGSPRIRKTRKLLARRLIPASLDLSDVVEPADQQDRRLGNRHEHQIESQRFGHFVTPRVDPKWLMADAPAVGLSIRRTPFLTSHPTP
jgi:hypothetical protein